jgi:MFS family permease
MDTLGATLGPIITFFLLLFVFNQQNLQNLDNYKIIFLLSLIPGLIAFSLTLLLKNNFSNSQLEKNNNSESDVNLNKKTFIKGGFVNYLKQIFIIWKTSKNDFKKLVLGLALTALVSGGDMFLILRLDLLGLKPTEILIVYIVFNLFVTILSYPVGILCDKLNFKLVYIFGLCSFGIATLLLSQTINFWQIIGTIFLYSLFPVINEVVAKAWITTKADTNNKPEHTGNYLGFALLATSLGSVISSTLIGFTWINLGSAKTYNLISLFVFILVLYFYIVVKSDIKGLTKIKHQISCNPKH